MRKTWPAVMALVLVTGLVASAGAQQRQLTAEERAQRAQRQQQQLQAELEMERPVDALNSVWIEELTYLEVRDALADGKTTAIISTGGIEQNGPYVAMGKHNYILQTACEWIARELGDALCAPIIKLVPEGDIDEPSGHMRYPGTISMRQETFEAMLTDVGASLAQHGFEHIIYIGDSGGNQSGMENVAAALNVKWADGDTRAHFIPEFYDNSGLTAFMSEELGIEEGESDGYHDFYWITALQMVTDPSTVRYEERVAKDLAMINGVSIAPMEETIEVGKKLMQWRVDRTVAAINAARSH